MNKGIRKMFSEVPDTYERINHLLTLHLDTVWRKRMAREAAGIGGSRWIDICTGTGETAEYLSRRSYPETTVYAADFSLPMIKKIFLKPGGDHIRCVLSDVGELPFPSSTFDLVTISFATRNLNLNREILTNSFKEFHRILKPGGHFFNLETSQPSNRIIRKLFHLYIRMAVPALGRWVSGAKNPYRYLSETIPLFYSSEELSAILKDGGFEKVIIKKKFFGVAAIHHGIKS